MSLVMYLMTTHYEPVWSCAHYRHQVWPVSEGGVQWTSREAEEFAAEAESLEWTFKGLNVLQQTAVVGVLRCARRARQLRSGGAGSHGWWLWLVLLLHLSSLTVSLYFNSLTASLTFIRCTAPVNTYPLLHLSVCPSLSHSLSLSSRIYPESCSALSTSYS